ncbi:MAG TPA: isochorismatase family protein [Actinomycetota bacterium]|nr:isochorismatase family protein [Actinomycetota bacterium]
MARYGPTTALIVVDVQNDFADPRGSLSVPGGEQALGAINRELAEARAAGAFVVFTQDWHPPVTPHFASDGGTWPEHCIGGSWGAELHRDLAALPDEPRIRKGVGGEDGYSGFTVADPTGGQRSPTGLEDLLRDNGIAQVVVVGLATDYCVKATALDAVTLGFPTVVVEDGVRAVDLAPGDGARAVAEMRAAGVTVA